MAEHGQVHFGDATIEYEVQRSQRSRKTVQITMDSGRVLVVAPTDTTGSKLEAIVHKRAPWILRHVPDPFVAPAKKRFVSGETLPYLGRDVRLIVEPSDVPSPRVRFDHWSFRIDVPVQLDDADRHDGIRKVVAHWYRRRAELRLPKAVEMWRKRIGLCEIPEVLIRDQRQRWGSYAPDGTLRFYWRVVMLAPALSEYVVVHELAHLRVSSHSTQFWDLFSVWLRTFNSDASGSGRQAIYYLCRNSQKRQW